MRICLFASVLTVAIMVSQPGVCSQPEEKPIDVALRSQTVYVTGPIDTLTLRDLARTLVVDSRTSEVPPAAVAKTLGLKYPVSRPALTPDEVEKNVAAAVNKTVEAKYPMSECAKMVEAKKREMPLWQKGDKVSFRARTAANPVVSGIVTNITPKLVVVDNRYIQFADLDPDTKARFFEDEWEKLVARLVRTSQTVFLTNRANAGKALTQELTQAYFKQAGYLERPTGWVSPVDLLKQGCDQVQMTMKNIKQEEERISLEVRRAATALAQEKRAQEELNRKGRTELQALRVEAGTLEELIYALAVDNKMQVKASDSVPKAMDETIERNQQLQAQLQSFLRNKYSGEDIIEAEQLVIRAQCAQAILAAVRCVRQGDWLKAEKELEPGRALATKLADGPGRRLAEKYDQVKTSVDARVNSFRDKVKEARREEVRDTSAAIKLYMEAYDLINDDQIIDKVKKLKVDSLGI